MAAAFSTLPPDTTRKIWRGRSTPLDLRTSRPCAPTRSCRRWWGGGGIGLDYYWLKTPEERANSRDFFTRPALGGVITSPPSRPRPGCPPGLPGHRPRPPRRPWGVHCYSSSLETPGAGGQGWMLSFTGNITFKRTPPGPDISAGCPGPAGLGDRRPYMAPSRTGASGATHRDRPLRRDGGPAPGPPPPRLRWRPSPWRTASSLASPEGGRPRPPVHPV